MADGEMNVIGRRLHKYVYGKWINKWIGGRISRQIERSMDGLVDT
jgi:hypothetical protein